jgi:hypothetical protein
MGLGFVQRHAATLRAPRVWAWLASAAAGLVIARPAAAQPADAAFARSEVLDTIIVTNPADMDFGRITPRGTPGTVTMTASAGATCTPSGTLLRSGACRAARFDGDVTFLYTLRITKPAGGQIMLTGPAGATMQLNNFTLGAGGGLWDVGSSPTEQRYLVLNITGNFTVYVGGTLVVAGNQRPGVYNGTFSMTFNYD